MKRQLEQYAVILWIQHFLSVNIEASSTAQIIKVVKGLHEIFEKPERASLLFETYSDGTYSGFKQQITDRITSAVDNLTRIPSKLGREHFRH